MAISCTVCDHPQRNVIDAVLAAGTLSARSIALQYGLIHTSVNRHKRNHLTKKLSKAVERKEEKAADRLLSDVEYLWAKSKQYVEDAESAIKVQCYGKDDYRELRDVGAMAPALAAAHANRRLFGDATGVLASSQAGATLNVDRLMIILPRELPPAQVVEIAPGGPAIDATCEPLPLVVDNNPGDDSAE